MKRLIRASGTISLAGLFLAFGGLSLLAEGTTQGEPARSSIRSGTARMVPKEKIVKTEGIAPPGPLGDHYVHIQEVSGFDSYDSRIGPYLESKSGDVTVGSNCNPNDSEAGISADNNSVIEGNLSVTTPTEEGDIKLLSGANLTGEKLYSQPRWLLLPINAPAWYTVAGGGPEGQIDGEYGSMPGKYEITSNNLIAYNNAIITFHAGRYHFSNFELRANVQFIVDPAIGANELIEIYVDNSIIFENNNELLPAIAITGDSTKIRFYFNGTTTVDLSNNVKFFGFIYAPKAIIEIRNNDQIYGNLVGKALYLWNNAGVHFDKALLDQDFSGVIKGGQPAVPWKRVDWKEQISTGPTPIATPGSN